MTSRTPYQRYGTRRTPQSEAVPGTDQVPNSAGGFAWAIDNWARLDRFLILGSEGGTYYIKERELTRENAQAVEQCLKEDGPRTVARIVEISEGGRAPSNEPAIFALAMAFGIGDLETKRSPNAFDALPKVCRTGTHLFHFQQYVEQFRGWGVLLRRAVGAWYETMAPDARAYQLVKYQSRDGVSHRDMLRLSKPNKIGGKRHLSEADAAIAWAVGKPREGMQPYRLVEAYEEAQSATTKAHIIKLINDDGLTHEMLPTQWKTEPDVWASLLVAMPPHAMIRNLATMTRLGLVAPMSDAASWVAEHLKNGEWLVKNRVHPIDVLKALMTYKSGHSVRGKNTWDPVAQVVDALDAAFYLTFGSIEPTGKRHMLALDVSGSMTMGEVAGVPGLTPRVAAAAMALITANVEPNHQFVCFSDTLMPLDISPRQRIDDVLRVTDRLPFSRTDCAQPMLYATAKELDIEMFVILTDSETWCGDIHPSQALVQYRENYQRRAKLAVVGMVSNGFSIADPNDAGMLDCVGFDTATPGVIAGFAAS